mgnify:CR=1 FL=1
MRCQGAMYTANQMIIPLTGEERFAAECTFEPRHRVNKSKKVSATFNMLLYLIKFNGKFAQPTPAVADVRGGQWSTPKLPPMDVPAGNAKGYSMIENCGSRDDVGHFAVPGGFSSEGGKAAKDAVAV